MNFLDDIRHDVRYALHMLRRERAFAAAAILTLGIGIGIATGVFSVVNGVLLRPLPYADAGRLAFIWNDFSTGQSLPAINADGVREYRTRSRLFEEFSYGTGTRDMFAAGIVTSGDAPPERVQVNSVSANFLPMLDAHPILGEPFRPEDEAVGSPNVVLISHALWQRRFGGDPAAVGGVLEIDGQPYRILGVLPPAFRLLLPAEAYSIADADVWTPARIDWAEPIPYTIWTVIGRMRPGVTIAQAQAELGSIAAAMRAESETYRSLQLEIRAIPLRHDITKAVRPTLLLLLAAAGLLVLTASANVANLLLARATAREREVSIRIAIGASRPRLARQLMTEGLVLSAAGAVLGLGLAAGAVAALGRADVALPRLDEVGIDWTVLGFVLGVCALTTLLFGLAPAFHGLRDVRNALTGAARATTTGRQPWLRNGLVVAEITLSLVLLVAAGLLVRSHAALQRVSPGFEADGVVTFDVALPRPEYLFPQRLQYTTTLMERLAGLPGVTAVGASSLLPLTGQPPTSSYQFIDDDGTVADRLNADRVVVTSGYLEAAGTRLLEGRDFLPSDVMDAPQVVIIDEQIARRGWPNESAVGKTLRVSGFGDEPVEIVGVVEHMRIHDLALDGLPQIYFSYHARPTGTAQYFVRTSLPPEQITEVVGGIVAELDPDVPASHVAPLRTVLDEHFAGPRLNLLLMQLIGAIALLLAGIGLYGVIAFAVDQRRAEFAVRLALGETTRGIALLVLRRGLALVLVGLPLGIVAAIIAGRLMRSVLFGISPNDPATIVGVAAFLLLVAAAACWLPAFRAARLAPAAVLRTDT